MVISADRAEDGIDGVHHITTHHGDLVDDQEFYLAQELLPLFIDTDPCQELYFIGLGGEEGLEGQLKKTV